jgi:hypothetical protein
MVQADIKVSFMAPQEICESRARQQFAAACGLLEEIRMRGAKHLCLHPRAYSA